MHENEVDFTKDDEMGAKLSEYGYLANQLSPNHVEALLEQVVSQGVFEHISNAKLWFKGFVG